MAARLHVRREISKRGMRLEEVQSLKKVFGLKLLARSAEVCSQKLARQPIECASLLNQSSPSGRVLKKSGCVSESTQNGTTISPLSSVDEEDARSPRRSLDNNSIPFVTGTDTPRKVLLPELQKSLEDACEVHPTAITPVRARTVVKTFTSPPSPLRKPHRSTTPRRIRIRSVPQLYITKAAAKANIVRKFHF